jgi:hypothetical protein
MFKPLLVAAVLFPLLQVVHLAEPADEFLAYMLGVRRVGITAAASAMQNSGLIEYRRGDVQVLDRSRLEATACACYGNDQRAYAEMLG